MKEKELFELINTVGDLDREAMKEARRREDSLAKPPGSLGRLEDIAVQLSGISGNLHNSADKSCVAVMCSDNGVVEEGVSSAPQFVTLAQTINFTRRLTGVGTLAKYFDSDLLVVDLGINADLPKELLVKEALETAGAETRVTNKIVDRKIRKSTYNLAKEPAMSREEAVEAIGVGIEMACEIKKAGYTIFGIGEMGIGNTTTSSAILSALTGLPALETVGKGGGITDRSFARKKEIIDNVAERYGYRGQADLDVIDILAKVGGFDVAAMAGAFLGAAIYRLPVVIDGFISVVAALTAMRIAPLAKEYMIASHLSKEQGYSRAMSVLGLPPMLNLDLRLGEGSGCPLAFQIIRGACAIMNDMATFAEAEINDDYLEEIRKLDF
ncbi:MAG TPA: nicotinate-nucleotide--dimethylbenzimidazole phosphoribosyltransferase [Anaerovoracaceae bacterium]|nr:nicotinate-nucleotide--dimethylbenzimidazole phosphoribosyltransferase [Anaerovoracaceae bacterium]